MECCENFSHKLKPHKSEQILLQQQWQGATGWNLCISVKCRGGEIPALYLVFQLPSGVPHLILWGGMVSQESGSYNSYTSTQQGVKGTGMLAHQWYNITNKRSSQIRSPAHQTTHAAKKAQGACEAEQKQGCSRSLRKRACGCLQHSCPLSVCVSKHGLSNDGTNSETIQWNSQGLGKTGTGLWTAWAALSTDQFPFVTFLWKEGVSKDAPVQIIWSSSDIIRTCTPRRCAWRRASAIEMKPASLCSAGWVCEKRRRSSRDEIIIVVHSKK